MAVGGADFSPLTAGASALRPGYTRLSPGIPPAGALDLPYFPSGTTAREVTMLELPDPH